MGKLIYCSHKYGGNPFEKLEAEQKIKALQMQDLTNTYISPIHAFGFEYYDYDYDTGIKFCLDLLSKCDKMIVLSGISKGVQIEIEYCLTHGISYEIKDR